MPVAKILAVADLHLGRNPTRCAAQTGPTLSTAAMWENIVDLAISETVEVVAMAGDVVNSGNAFFSSLGVVERGLRRLEDAGIITIAVAGNHDVDLLARLATVLDSESFIILGRGGSWESKQFTSKTGATIDFWGKSFTSEQSSGSPLTSFPRGDIRPNATSLGLLHCDLGGSGNYAPVRETDLLSSGLSTWILGHIHAPTPLPAGPIDSLAFYCGSPLPLDPTETGVHGPCMIEVDGSGVIQSIRRVPISPLRYEGLPVDLTGIEDLDAAREAIAVAIRRRADEALAESTALGHLALRLQLVGRSRLSESDVSAMVTAQLIEGDGARSLHGGVDVFVEKVSAVLAPPLDMAAFAGQSTPLGVVADLLAELESGAPSPELDDVLVELEAMIGRFNEQHGSGINADGLPDADAIRTTARDQVLKIAHLMHDQLDARP